MQFKENDDLTSEIAFFKRREFSFTYQGDIYQRYQSFTNDKQFLEALVERKPEKIDIGAVFASPPDKNQVNVPTQREFVIDIDMTDYDDVRTCCSEAKICSKCWLFIQAAVEILCVSLKEDFGFQDILCVFSGRRGIHLWICDDFARLMDNQIRSSVIDNLNLIGSGFKEGSKLKKGMIIQKQKHYQFERAYQILKKYFKNIEQQQQGMLIKKKNLIGQIIKQRKEDLWNKIQDTTFRSANDTSSIMKLIEETNQIIYGFKEEIIVNLLYPRLDVNVSKTMNHLLKAPFSLHPKTGKVCVPFTEDKFHQFDPFKTPTMQDLFEYIKKVNYDKEKLKDDNNPMASYVKIFNDFIENSVDNKIKTDQQREKNRDKFNQRQNPLEDF